MAKHWMAKAFKNSHGQERDAAHAAGKSTRAYAEEHKGSPGKTGQRARLALQGMKAKKG